jgi:hypothetical protein
MGKRSIASGASGSRDLTALAILTAACLSAACADATGNESVEQRVAALTAVPELKGALLTTGGGLFNRCVRDVPTSFASLPSARTNRAAYISKGGQRLPPYNAFLFPFFLALPASGSPPFSVPHVQSLARFDLGDDQDDRWLAVSRAFELGSTTGLGGVFLVRLPDMAGADGGPMLAPGVNYLSPVPASRATQYYYQTEGSIHPGGMQAFGHYLAVANEVEGRITSFVDIYDFSAGFGAGQLIQRVSMFSTGFPGPIDKSITGVAVTRLKDGRYLMFVLGKDNAHHGWFFVTRDAALPSTWDPVDYFDGNADTTFFADYQNVNFVTDCGTGNIFMFASGNSDFQYVAGAGTDYLDLFKLDADLAVGVHMTFGGRRTFNTNPWDTCTFRAAATLFTAKDNRLILYCHAYTSNFSVSLSPFSGITVNPDPTLRFVEFNHQGCLYTEVACGSACCDQGDSCVNGACCPGGNVVGGVCCAPADACGSVCCSGAGACKDASLSLCCDPFAVKCGSVCCGVDQECVDDVCQAPPPPPPPPPPGSCSDGAPTCSVGADCPANFNECNGGCCSHIH